MQGWVSSQTCWATKTETTFYWKQGSNYRGYPWIGVRHEASASERPTNSANATSSVGENNNNSLGVRIQWDYQYNLQTFDRGWRRWRERSKRRADWPARPQQCPLCCWSDQMTLKANRQWRHFKTKRNEHSKSVSKSRHCFSGILPIKETHFVCVPMEDVGAFLRSVFQMWFSLRTSQDCTRSTWT